MSQVKQTASINGKAWMRYRGMGTANAVMEIRHKHTNYKTITDRMPVASPEAYEAWVETNRMIEAWANDARERGIRDEAGREASMTYQVYRARKDKQNATGRYAHRR